MGLAAGSSGQTASLSLRGAVLTLATCAICAWVFALWFVGRANATRDFTFRVTEIVEGQDAAHPYAVEVDHERQRFSFRRPTGLDVGDSFEARYDLAGQYVGWSHNGRFTSKQDQPSKVVFLLPAAVALCLTCVTVYIARGERVPHAEADG